MNSAIKSIRLAASEISLRVEGRREIPPDSLQEEMESLKRELRAVREERGTLREEVEGLKRALSLHGPPPSPSVEKQRSDEMSVTVWTQREGVSRPLSPIPFFAIDAKCFLKPLYLSFFFFFGRQELTFIR